MKTFLTLAAACLFTVATMAADRRPSVTIQSKRNFHIVVDGKRFSNDRTIRLRNIHRGMHTIKVYERRRGLFGRRMHLVSIRRFFVGNNDMRIEVDFLGRVNIDELRRGRDFDRYGKDRDWDNNRNRGNNRRGYGNRKF